MTSLLLIEIPLDKAVQLAESELLPRRFTWWAAELINELYSLGYQQEAIKVFPPPKIPLYWYRNKINELQVSGPKAEPVFMKPGQFAPKGFTFVEPAFNGTPITAASGVALPARAGDPVYGYTITGNLSSGGFANVNWDMNMNTWIAES